MPDFIVSLLVSFLYLQLRFTLVTAETVLCNGATGACQNQNVSCLVSGNCYFNCGIDDGCNNAGLQCLDGYSCEIYSGLNDPRSVRDSAIHCPTNSNCTLSGAGGNGAYRNAEIWCGDNGNCAFTFDGHTGVNAMQFKFFNAINSSYLYIKRNGTLQYSPSLRRSRVFCPRNKNDVSSQENCQIDCYRGRDGVGSGNDTSCRELKVFAVNGFNDVFIYDETDNVNITLACGKDFEYQCHVLSPNVTQCAGYGGAHECDYSEPTTQPTNMPTAIPTIQPTQQPVVSTTAQS